MTAREDVPALIADNRKWVRLHRENKYQKEAARRMSLVLDALEAERERAEEAERAAEDHVLDAEATYERMDLRVRKAEHARDQLAARIERLETTLADAADSEATAVHRADRLQSRLAEVEQERNALAAVVEKVREYVEGPASRVDLPVWPTNISRFLASAPTDALREVKASAIREYVEAARENPHTQYWPASGVLDDAEQWADEIEKGGV